MTKPRHPASNTETAVGSVILAVLAAIAAGLFLKQSQYDSMKRGGRLGTLASRKILSGHGFNLGRLCPGRLLPMSAVETFDRDNLSDKIDGKAELYLAAGVSGMKCQRLVDRRDAAAWFEVFVYDMGELG